jgi:hypothetical protein
MTIHEAQMILERMEAADLHVECKHGHPLCSFVRRGPCSGEAHSTMREIEAEEEERCEWARINATWERINAQETRQMNPKRGEIWINNKTGLRYKILSLRVTGPNPRVTVKSHRSGLMLGSARHITLPEFLATHTLYAV